MPRYDYELDQTLCFMYEKFLYSKCNISSTPCTYLEIGIRKPDIIFFNLAVLLT